jgi:hypothetical protein
MLKEKTRREARPRRFEWALKGLNVPIDRGVRPLEVSGLPEELAEGTQGILDYFSENYGFLPSTHEIPQQIQQWADAIKNPTSGSTRVMVLLDEQINAMALPDGTIIYTAGLVNRLIQQKALKLLPYPLLHEVPHFERSHSQQTWNYWFGEESATGIMKNYVSFLGMKRWHEYEADMTALFKAEKLGLPAIEYSTLLRVIGGDDQDDDTEDDDDDDDDFQMDFVHGNTYDRELNVALAHTILEFSSSSKKPPKVSFKQTGKIYIPPSRNQELLDATNNSELLARFDERSPNFRSIFLQQELSVLTDLFYSEYRSATEKHNTKKIAKAKQELTEQFSRLGALFSHIEEAIRAEMSDISPLSLRRAMQCILNNVSNERISNLWEVLKRVKQELPDLEIPESFSSYLHIGEEDFSVEAYRDYMRWHNNEELYRITRLKIVENDEVKFPSMLWAAGGIPDLISEDIFTFKDRKVEQILNELAEIAEYMREAGYFIDHIAWRFKLIGAEKVIAGYLSMKQSQGETEDTLIQETVRLLHYVNEQLDVDIWSYDKFAAAILGLEMYSSDPRKKLLENKISILREPVSTDFLAAIKDRNSEKTIQLINSDRELFLKELGRAKKSGEYKLEDWVFLRDVFIENWESLLISWPIDFSDFKMEEKMVGYWTNLLGADRFAALIEQEEDNDTYDDFSRLRLLLEIAYIFSAEDNFNEKDDILSLLIRRPIVQEILAKLSIFQLDHIIRSYCRETTNLTIDVLDTSWARYDLTLDEDYNQHRLNEFQMGDRVMQLLPITMYEQKLRAFVQPNTLEETAQYYQFVVDLVVLYGYGGFDSNQQSIPTETAARLVESATSSYYQKILESIEAATTWEGQRDLYYFLKSDFRFRPDDKRILSQIQNKIITNPEAPIDLVLDFIEGEVNRGFLTISALRSFIQLRLKTYDTYIHFSDRVTHILDGFTANRGRDIGAAAIGEQLVEHFSTPHGMFSLFEAMMESGHDDTKLREMIAPWYWKYWITKKNLGESRERGYEVILDDDDNPYVSGASLQNFVTFNEVIEYLYDLPEVGKMFLLRKLFLSKTGLLIDRRYAQEMSQIFISTLQHDGVLTPRIKAFTEAALSVGDPVYMFLTFSQALMPLFLQKPNAPADMRSIASTISFSRNDWNMISFDNVFFTREQVFKILSFDPPHKKQDDSSPTAKRMVGLYSQVIDTLETAFADKDQPSTAKVQSNRPVAVVKKIASSTAPLGTGTIQVSSQLVHISGPYAELIDVYDNNEGQTFFSAMFMIDKKSENPAVAHFLRHQFISFEEVVGAGKVATTIRSKVRNAQGQIVDAAIKVLNPNALTWTRIMTAEAEKLVAYVQEHHSLSDKDTTVATKALGIVSDWIEEELVDPRYLYFDNMVRPLHEDQPTSTRFTIRFPKRLGPQTDEIKVDEYIDGENIGRYFRNPNHTPQEKREAAQALADTIIRTLNIPTSDGNYALLKDISQGNAIITDNAIYPLDRQYASITPADRDFIHSFLREGLTLQAINRMVEYFGTFSENAHLSQAQKSALVSRLRRKFITKHVRESFFKRQGSDADGFTDTLNMVIKALDEEKLVIPPYFRLFVLKTIMSTNIIFEEGGVDKDFQQYYKLRTT